MHGHRLQPDSSICRKRSVARVVANDVMRFIVYALCALGAVGLWFTVLAYNIRVNDPERLYYERLMENNRMRNLRHCGGQCDRD